METQTKSTPANFPNVRGYIEKDKDGKYSFEFSGDEPLKEVGMYQILPIIHGFEYKKRLVESSLNLSSLCFQNSLSKNRPDYNSQITSDGLNIEMVHLLNEIGRFCGYLVNSTSWQDQKLKDFDKFELKDRLQKIIKTIK
jgi:hypothetical protein